MKPATAAARPISSLPAAPVDSASPPEDVPVAPAAPVPEGLGAEPVAVARVPLLEVSTLRPPVLEAEADAPVPLGLTEPVEVGTLVAVVVLVFVPLLQQLLVVYGTVVRTDFDALTVADVCDSAQSRLCVITAEFGDLGGEVLGLANALEVRRVGVLVDGTEEAARGRSNSKLCESEEGSGEDGLGEHVGGACGCFVVLRTVVRSSRFIRDVKTVVAIASV